MNRQRNNMMNEMIIKYQLLMARQKQLEENGLLKLSDYLISNDYDGFEKYLSMWAEKQHIPIAKAAFMFMKFEDDFIDLQTYTMEKNHERFT